MDQLMRDVRFGIRMLAKRPGTTALAVAALALGIGLTTTMFSIVNGAFLRGLPFDGADRIVYVGERMPDQGDGRPFSSKLDDFLALRQVQQSFDALAAYRNFTADVAADGVAPARHDAATVTPNLLGLLRVRPAIGRDFTAADAEDSAPAVVLIADAVWTGQFNRDPGILNRVIRVNGKPATVIGVMPGRFGFPQTQAVWMPLKDHPAALRKDSVSVDIVGRLAGGVSRDAAQAEVRGLVSRIAASDPALKGLTGGVVPFVHRYIGPQIITTLSMMLAAVFGVLLIACVNVTNLQLARAADRVREVGIRLAMGASRARMIRQLLVEGLLVAALGTLLGLAIAQAGVTFFMRGIADTEPPFWIVAELDWRVLGFATLLTVVAALASSLVPAFRVTRTDVHAVLKDAGRANTSLSMGRFTRVLVAVEITLSFVLLVVSGLMIKSVVETNRIVFPFRTDLLHARVEWTTRDYPDDDAVRRATERLLESATRAPGVAAAAITTALPDRAADFPVLIDGAAHPGADRIKDLPRSRRAGVTPGYFQVMGLRALQGRLIEPRDGADQEKVAVVTTDFAARFFPKTSPIGHRVQLLLRDSDDNPWWTIVGVVPTLAVAARGTADTPETVLVPMTQLNSRNALVLAAASDGDPGGLAPAIRRAVIDLNPDLPLFEVNTIAGIYRLQTWPFRVFGTLFMSFGLSALVMAAAGLYGVMAFSVKRRTQEIGVRMALGADAPRIMRMVLKQGAVLSLIGMAAGAGLGGLLGNQLKLLLFGVTPWDPPVFGVTMAVLGGAAFLATFIPARRAATTDPLAALRDE